MPQDQPSKLYYSISEVAKLTGVKAHVLRYWEAEFPSLKPRKTRSGSRRYRQVDIDEIQAIKTLLYDEGFKIAGARKMRRHKRSGAKQDAAPPQLALGFEQLDTAEQLTFLKEELQQLLVLVKGLKEPATGAKAAKGRKMQGRG